MTAHHRGRPDHVGVVRAFRLSEKLNSTVKVLVRLGWDEQDAIRFIRKTAREEAAAMGEDWANDATCFNTHNGILTFRASKDWAMDAMTMALHKIGRLPLVPS